MTGRALVAQADALRLPLPDASVHLVVTSPPFLWKRKYAIQHPGEIGNEPNWRLYLDNLYAATDEMLRVLKPTGSIWVNLGDTRVTGREPKWLGIPVKSRLLLPERYRVGCQDRYASRGVIVRQVQIHDKSNGLPESVDDRTRDSHEDWVQIVKQPNYYAALDTLREPHADKSFTVHTTPYRGDGTESTGGKFNRWLEESGNGRQLHPLGKVPGSVWRIPSDPLKLPAWLGIDHYAAFSPEWPRRLVLGFSPPGICEACGQGRWPVVEKQREYLRAGDAAGRAKLNGEGIHGTDRRAGTHVRDQATILGYACSCCPFTDHPGTGGVGDERRPYSEILAEKGYPSMKAYGGRQGLSDRPKVGPWREYHLDTWRPPPTRPAIVADVFGGVGTTALVARALGRIGLSFDLSHAYSRAARWRVFESGEWQDIIARTTGRRVRPLPKHDPTQTRLL